MMHFNTTGMAVGLGGAQLGGPFDQSFGPKGGTGPQFNVPVLGPTVGASAPPIGGEPLPPFPPLPPPARPLPYTFENWLTYVYKKLPGKPYEDFKKNNAATKQELKDWEAGKKLEVFGQKKPQPLPDYTYQQFLAYAYGQWWNAQQAKAPAWAAWAKAKNEFLAKVFKVKPMPLALYAQQFKAMNPNASATDIGFQYELFSQNFEVDRLASYYKPLYDKMAQAQQATADKSYTKGSTAFAATVPGFQNTYAPDSGDFTPSVTPAASVEDFKKVQAQMAAGGPSKSAGMPKQFGFAGFKPQQVQVKVATVKPIAKIDTPAETPAKLAEIFVAGASSGSQVFLRSDGIAVNWYSQPWDAVDEKGNISDPVLGAEAGFTVSPVEVGVGDLNGKLAFASTDGKQVFGYVKRVPYKGSFVLQNEPLPKQPEPVTTPAAPVGGGGGGGGGGTGWGGPVFAKEPEPTVVLPPPAVPVQKSALPLLALLAAGAYALSR